MDGRIRHQIPYAPRAAFVGFHNTTRRWSIICAHRRSGKTVASINKLIKAAAECTLPDPRFGYVAPYLSQAKEIAWNYLKRYSEPIWAEPPNESELRLTLFNGATIRLHGSDNPDRLRGAYFDGVVMDEFATQRTSVWGEIVRPMLADRRGWAAFIGTPRGQNAFYDLWRMSTNNPEWFRLMIRADQSNILSPDELEAMQKDMSPEEFDQELLCSFMAAIKGAYYAEQLRRMEAEGRICHIDIERTVRVHTAWDLGRADATAIWFIQCVGRRELLVVADDHQRSRLRETEACQCEGSSRAQGRPGVMLVWHCNVLPFIAVVGSHVTSLHGAPRWRFLLARRIRGGRPPRARRRPGAASPATDAQSIAAAGSCRRRRPPTTRDPD